MTMCAKHIAFGSWFDGGVSPPKLVADLLRAGLGGFLQPKVGQVSVDGEILRFGPCSIDRVRHEPGLIEGEEVIASGLTALTGHPDATQEIADFVARFPRPSRSLVEFVGDCRLDYVRDGSVTEGWVFRDGSEGRRWPIMWFDASSPRRTSVHLNAACPWFFLRDWWPERDTPRYSTPETAERNWDRMVRCVRLIIDVAGIDNLLQLYLDLEGSLVCRESEWLVERARELPGLQVHMA